MQPPRSLFALARVFHRCPVARSNPDLIAATMKEERRLQKLAKAIGENAPERRSKIVAEIHDRSDPVSHGELGWTASPPVSEYFPRQFERA